MNNTTFFNLNKRRSDFFLRKKNLKAVVCITVAFLIMIICQIEVKAQSNFIEQIINSVDNIGVFKHFKDIKGYQAFENTKKVSNLKQDLKLIPLGTPVGLKINTKGVLVVAISDITTLDNTKVSPAVRAGIQIGDVVTHINNIEINTGEEMSYYVNNSGGNPIQLTINRNDTPIILNVTPVQHHNDLKYKIGLWVRDYTAGVGMMTFVQKDTNIVGALGHPITDIDTDQIINVLKGDMVEASIVNIRKGTRGYPGELKGQFKDDNIIGIIDKNSKFGIFGKIYDNNEVLNGSEYSVAFKDEIVEGPATIITTIEGEDPKEYSINIEKLLNSADDSGKNMIIKITDEELLSKTEGIVQGMSGSPIIQNNKIVGAVTHVLLNKPEIGYGIYIESMLVESGIIK